MTDDQMKNLRALCEKATPGPWSWDGSALFSSGSWDDLLNAEESEPSPEDAAFIAAARSALPAALDEVERLRVRVFALEATLAEQGYDFDEDGL